MDYVAFYRTAIISFTIRTEHCNCSAYGKGSNGCSIVAAIISLTISTGVTSVGNRACYYGGR